MDYFKKHSYVVLRSKAAEISENISFIDIETFGELRIKKCAGLVYNPDYIFEGDLTDQFLTEVSLQDFADSMGEWIAVASRGEESIAIADTYGYCPLFYGMISGVGVIVSDTFTGVISGLRQNGVYPTIDSANYAAILPNWVGHFLGPFDEHTMANEVRLLRPDQALHVTAEKVAKVDRRFIGRSREATSPRMAIERGMDWTAGILARLANQTGVENRIRLSGGSDSRMVLAMLAATGYEKSFTVQSTDPRSLTGAAKDIFSKDISIADYLRRHYGMKWSTPFSSNSFALTFEETLAYHQGYNSNFSWNFSAASNRVIPDHPILTLIGGGGEVARMAPGAGFLPGEIFGRNISVESLPLEEQERVAVDWLLDRHAYTDELKPIVRERLLSAIRNVSGASFQEKLQHHYFDSRNRSHFGHQRFSASSNSPVAHLVSNPHLLWASKFIPYKMRVKDEFTRLLLAETDSWLLGVEFESQETTANLCGTEYSKVPTISDWEIGYDRVASGKVNHNVLQGFGNRHVVPFDPVASQLTYLRMAFSEIENCISDPTTRNALHVQHEKMLVHASNASLHPNWLVARAASVLEVVYPMEVATRAAVFPTVEDGLDAVLQTVKVRTPSVVNDGWNDQTIPSLTVQLRAVADDIEVSLKVQNAPLERFELAIYLLADGVRVAQKLYPASPTEVFRDVAGSGRMQAIGFLRLAGAESPIVIERSDEVVL